MLGDLSTESAPPEGARLDFLLVGGFVQSNDAMTNVRKRRVSSSLLLQEGGAARQRGRVPGLTSEEILMLSALQRGRVPS